MNTTETYATSGTGTDALSLDGTTDQTITNVTRECKNPLCHRTPPIGKRYCGRHEPSFDITTPQPTPDPAPSRRDLQRQLDRIEGKLDALLNEDD